MSPIGSFWLALQRHFAFVTKLESQTLKLKLHFALHSHNQTDGLSEALLIYIKSQELRLAQMQSRGDMENVRQPMTTADCIPSAQVFGQMMRDCPVYRYRLQYIVPQVRIQIAKHLRSLKQVKALLVRRAEFHLQSRRLAKLQE